MALTLDPKRKFTEAEMRSLTRQWRARNGYEPRRTDRIHQTIFWTVLYGLGAAIILVGYLIAVQPR